jgi:hypothetical protein
MAPMLWRLRAFPDFVEPCLPSQVERLAQNASTPSAKDDFLAIKCRWLSLAPQLNFQNGYRISRANLSAAIKWASAPVRHGAEPRRSIRKSMKAFTLGA